MTEVTTNIPARLKNAAVGGHVAGVEDIVDDVSGKTQAEINTDINSTLTTHQNEINTLNSQNYESVTATEQTTAATDVLPATGEADTIYRVGSWDGAQYDATCYSEYAWKGDAYIHLSTKPQIGEVFDISAYRATGGTLAKYADLSAALDGGNNIPSALRKGGMSVKFIQGSAQSSDNKYVQYRLMSDTFNTNPANWQGVDDVPTAGSDNLVKSGGVYTPIFGGVVEYVSYITGFYSDTSLNIISADAFRINKYRISGTRIHVKSRTLSNMYCAWFDNSDNVIGTPFAGNSGSGYSFDEDLDIPNGAEYISISHVVDDGYTCTVTSLDTGIKGTVEQIEKTLYSKLKLSSIEDSAFYSSPTGDKNTSIADFSIAHYDIIESISTIHIKGRTIPSTYILFFDKNDTILSYTEGNSGSGINTDDDYTVPSGCTHFGISYVNIYELIVSTPENDGIVGKVEEIDKKVEEIDKVVNPDYYSTKKFGLIGDSIAANGGFIAKAADILGFTYKNVAIGGWMLGDKEGVSVYKQVNGVAPANVGLDGDEDMVIIFAGTNDFGHALTIGEPYIVDADGHRSANQDDLTTCGGLEKTIQTLYTKYNGYIPIIICLPLQRSLEGTYSSGGSWDKNDIDKYMDDYADGIKAVAQYYGIPVCDFYNINMNPNIPAANTKYFSDGLHPNTAGHNLMGRWLAKFIEAHAFDV